MMGRGRPTGSQGPKKASKGTSRLKVKCAVCSFVKRSDKVKEHQLQHVLFDRDGNAADASHPKYSSLSAVDQEHTDYFRTNGFTRTRLPSNKIIHQVKVGEISSFFSKKKDEDINQNCEEMLVDTDYEDTNAAGDTVHDNVDVDVNIEIGAAFENMEDSADTNSNHTVHPDPSRAQLPFSPDWGQIDHPVDSPPSETVVVEKDAILDSNDENGNLSNSTQVIGEVGNDIVQQIAIAVAAKFGNTVEIKNAGNISKVIAARVVERMEDLKKKEEILKEDQCWREDATTNTVFCIACTKFATHLDVPPGLKKFNKGSFGLFKKSTVHKKIKEKLINHVNTPLHIWCKEKYNGDEEQRKLDTERNIKACKMVVMNAAHVLKDPAGSATDFQKLNNKDQLLLGEEYPTKNDGKQMYFELRKEFHLKLRNKIHEMMKKVKFIAASLDKVTVGGVAYTVICTYYFWHGELKVFLNELVVMSTDMYDGEGVARMLCGSLMKTLGLSLEELAEKLEHLSFDGVYADTTDRVRGGGSLNLSERVGEYLGFGQMSGKIVSNNWDLGHRMQLSIEECLVKSNSDHSKEYLKNTGEMFALMKAWKDDKDGLLFQETSDELRHSTLKQRGSQETRWVNADLLGKKTFLRNAPTIYACFGRKMEEYRIARNQTKQKEIENKIKPMMDFEFWVMMIGYMQFQNILTEASLEAQHSSYFSSSSIYLVLKAVNKVRDLGNDWQWEEDDLFFAQVGSPKQYIENLKDGFFMPKVTLQAKQKRAAKINSLIQYKNEVELRNDPEDFVTAEDITEGTIPVSGYELYKLLRAEAKLKDICKDFCSAFDERVKVSKLMEVAIEIFHEDDGDWFVYQTASGKSVYVDGDEMDEDEKVEAGDILERNDEEGSRRIKKLLDAWDQPVANSYDVESLTGGYLLFTYFRKRYYKTPDGGREVLEDVYKGFTDSIESREEAKDFMDMFERIQIKSFSEAVCETIGSIMSIAKGKGRNCEPVHFSEEVTLCYNLPPLHVLARSFIPELVTQLTARKDFFRKGDQGPQSIRSRLVSSTLSASLFNFRQSQEKKCKLPQEFFS